MAISQRSVRHELVRRYATVSAVTRAAPSIVRVTLAGAELKGFASLGPADHIKVFFPDPAADDPTELVARDFTPVEFRAEDGADPELDIDFVVHGHEGPASAWALAAAPGVGLTIAGPRGSRLVPDGLDRLILVVDETGLPAASRWLRLTPPEIPVTVVLDLVDPANASYLDPVPAAERATILPVSRALEDGLVEAVRALGPIGPATMVFLAGEATRLVALRRYLRRELELPPEQVIATGYWKRGVVALDHHAPIDPADPD